VTSFSHFKDTGFVYVCIHKSTEYYGPGLSNLSAMVDRIDFIVGVAGQYAISAAIKAMSECDFLNVLI